MEMPDRAMTNAAMIVGAGGVLGRALVDAFNDWDGPVFHFDDESSLDISQQERVLEIVSDISPSVLLNAAAYTDVDGAEGDAVRADEVNRMGPANLARACCTTETMLVHFSTDYVFGGTVRRPLKITDPTSPSSVYARTKLAGERVIHQSACAHLIIRTSWLFAEYGGNFVRTIARLAQERDVIEVVDDQRGRPTYAADLASITRRLVDAKATGIFHAANDDECTWHEFAEAIVSLSNARCMVKPCSTDAFRRPARRPAYSVLDLSKTTELLGPIRPWRDALQQCLSRMTVTSESTSVEPGARKVV